MDVYHLQGNNAPSEKRDWTRESKIVTSTPLKFQGISNHQYLFAIWTTLSSCFKTRGMISYGTTIIIRTYEGKRQVSLPARKALQPQLILASITKSDKKNFYPPPLHGMLVHCKVNPRYFAGTQLYTRKGGGGNVRVSSPTQGHNTTLPPLSPPEHKSNNFINIVTYRQWNENKLKKRFLARFRDFTMLRKSRNCTS